MRCVLERFQNDLKLLVQPTKTLKSEGFFKTNKVYIECRGSAEDQKVPFQISRFYHLLDRHQNTIRIHVNLPLLCKLTVFNYNFLRLLFKSIPEINSSKKPKYQNRERDHQIFVVCFSFGYNVKSILVIREKALKFEPPPDKTSKISVRPAKTQISLGICPVWSESLLSAWRNIGSLATH